MAFSDGAVKSRQADSSEPYIAEFDQAIGGLAERQAETALDGML
jgi:hypothetical protein